MRTTPPPPYNAIMNTTILLLLLAFLPQDESEKKEAPAFSVLLAVTDDDRGENFRKLLTENGIACTVARYPDVTAKLINRHDMLMADSPGGSLREVLEKRRKANIPSFPRTDKPIFAIATLGHTVLRSYDRALSSIKT